MITFFFAIGEIVFAVDGKGEDGGIIFEKVDKRFLPFDYLANRTIGYVNENRVGAGLEYSFDKYLAGKDGEALYQEPHGGAEDNGRSFGV